MLSPAGTGIQLCPPGTRLRFLIQKSLPSLLLTSQGCREDQIQQMNVHPRFEGCIHDSHGDADGGAVTRGGRLDSIESQRFQPKLRLFVAASFPL